MSEKTIGQRINAVRLTCPYIKKDKTVETYKAVTHDQVTAELRNSLIEHGVLIVPQLVAGNTVNSGKMTSKGNPIIRFEGVFAVQFVNADNGLDVLTVIVPAHAEDHGDKAPGKATSYAVKSAMLKVFSIETGESDESRIQEEYRPYSEEDLATRKAMVELHTDLAALKKWARTEVDAADARGDSAASEQIKGWAIDRINRLSKSPEKAPPPAGAQDQKPEVDPKGEPMDVIGTNTANPAATPTANPAEEKVSAGMLKVIREMAKTAGVTEDQVCKTMKVEKLEDLTRKQATTVNSKLKATEQKAVAEKAAKSE